jgi:hypothetical protein
MPMKQYLNFLLTLTLLNLAPSLCAQSTAFIYQGQLTANGAPTEGSYDLTFTLYTNSSGGTATAGPVTNLATAVSNGLFSTRIDLSADAFNGSSNGSRLACGPMAARAILPS